MKKVLIGIICIVIIVVCAFFIVKNISKKSNEENEVQNSNQEQEGYPINVSKKEITIKKGLEESFEITFTNPDDESIREYIKCKDDHEIVLVQYSDLIDAKIKVDVKGLKVGTTEISICDYNYPEVKTIVKVNVVE